MKSIVTSFICLIASFIATGLVIAAIGENPLHVYQILLVSAFGSMHALGYTLFYATPLIFTGLAVATSLQAGLFNIGAEGQLHMGAFAVAILGIYVPESNIHLPWILLSMGVAFMGGAFWGSIPGILKAWRGSHEVISTIMMNFIAFAVLSYLTLYHFRDPNSQAIETPLISSTLRIAGLSNIIPAFGSSPANLSFVMALLVAAILWIYLWKTPQGFEIRTVGANPKAAAYAHISISKNMILAMTLSGGLAGLVALNDILGYSYRYKDSFSPGYGFLGIAVALLGKNHPFGVVLSAILFGALHNASIALDLDTEKVSRDLVGVLEGTIILFVSCEAFLKKYLERKK